MRARRDLGVTYRRLGRVLIESASGESLTYYLKSLKIADELHSLDPGNVDYRRDVAESELGLGMLARRSGRVSRAKSAKGD
jgi:hypothetical protein